MIKQNKGKDIHKIPKSKLVDKPYYYSTKFDGHWVSILFDRYEVVMWTSGGKSFMLTGLADYILRNFTEPFHIECEYTYGCLGKLGDRGKSARLTTYRTNYAKGNPDKGSPLKDNFYVLDRLDMPDKQFRERLGSLTKLFENRSWFTVPKQSVCLNLKDGQHRAQQDVLDGYEGGMLKDPDHIYQPGKRTNDIIKIKPRKTADLLCIDTKEGEGKYADGMIGALLLRDSAGRTVWAGSGLSDEQRNLAELEFIGKVVEIEYERIDETYIQPIIKHIRYDKSAEEID